MPNEMKESKVEQKRTKRGHTHRWERVQQHIAELAYCRGLYIVVIVLVIICTVTRQHSVNRNGSFQLASAARLVVGLAYYIPKPLPQFGILYFFPISIGCHLIFHDEADGFKEWDGLTVVCI